MPCSRRCGNRTTAARPADFFRRAACQASTRRCGAQQGRLWRARAQHRRRDGGLGWSIEQPKGARFWLKRCYGASDEVKAQSSLRRKPTECPMPQLNDLSRCLAALDQDSTLIAVIEMSQSRWLVTGIVPRVERHPAKKLEPDEGPLLGLLQRWRDEAEKGGRRITRIAVAPGLRRGRLLRRVVTASGWPAGCGRGTSKPMSSTRPASRCRGNTAAPRPTGSIARS